MEDKDILWIFKTRLNHVLKCIPIVENTYPLHIALQQTFVKCTLGLLLSAISFPLFPKYQVGTAMMLIRAAICLLYKAGCVLRLEVHLCILNVFIC